MHTARGQKNAQLLRFSVYVLAYGHWILLEEVWAATFETAKKRLHPATMEWLLEARERGESRVESSAA